MSLGLSEGRASLKVACLTDIGVQRQGSVNQDGVLSTDLPEGQLFVVADGMGGHNAGELASQLAITTFTQNLRSQRGPLLTRIIYAAEQANRAVYNRAVGELSGMGTTLLAASIAQSALYLAHIGDSRAYLLRGNSLFRLTDDHSWVAEQLRAGLLTPEQAQNHRWRNVVSNALGGEERVRLELLGVPLKKDDRLLLCTDGLYGPVSEEKILTVLSLPRPPEKVAQTLIDLANQAGGPDNVSVVVVDVLDLGAQRPPRQLPARRHEGPVYAEQLLSELRQGTPLNYLLLGGVYLVLLAMGLLPQHRLQVGLVGIAVLAALLFYAQRLNVPSEPALRPEAEITLERQPSGESWESGALKG